MSQAPATLQPPVLGTPSGSPGLAQPGLGAPVLPNVQRPYLAVALDDGSPVPYVLSATATHALDQQIASASVTCWQDPGVPNNSVVTIDMGAGLHNVRRFRGLYRRQGARLWPHEFTMNLTGMLGLAQRYQQARGLNIPQFVNQRLPITGLSLFQLLAIDTGPDPDHPDTSQLQRMPATDANIVLAVLQRVPGLDVDSADIGGTDQHFGSLAWRQLSWTPGQTALAYIQQFDQVCLGYRTYETLRGKICRSQVYGYPNNQADTTFTEGVDIWEATGNRSIEQLINSAYVEGYALGGEPGLIYGTTLGQEGNDFQPAEQPYLETFSSPLIESAAFARQVAEWRTTEGNRELVNVDLTTFRDDEIGLARTIAVNIPHADVTEPVWVQRVDISVTNQPVAFTQRISGLGGGRPAGGAGLGDYTPPEV